MTDDPTQAMGPIDQPTVPVEAVGGDSGPPTQAMPTQPADDEPPRGNSLRATIIVVLLLLVAALGLVLLTRDNADDRDDIPVDRTTSTSVSDTTTSAPADSTTTTEATTTTTEATTTTTTVPATGPSIGSLTASAVACPDPLTLTWTSTNAASVEVAIDSPGGVFDTGPPNGSMEVPAPCGGDTQTYYVTAIDSIGDRSTETLVLP